MHRARMRRWVVVALTVGLLASTVAAADADDEVAPDLHAGEVEASHAEPVVGAALTFAVDVKNLGHSDAGRFVVRFRVDGQDLSTEKVDGLASGASHLVGSDAWAATRGRHVVEAVVDADGDVSELDEHDNTEVLDVFVGEGPDRKNPPDLVIESITPSPLERASAGVIFVARVLNRGRGPARATTVTFTVDGISIGDGVLDTLPAGDVALVDSPVWMPAGKDPRRVGGEVDPARAVAEADEKNNTFTRALVLADPEPGVAMSGGDVAVRTVSVVEKEAVRVRANVCNVGATPVSAAQATFLWRMAGSSDAFVVIGEVAAGGLAPGQCRVVGTAWHSPPDGDVEVVGRATASEPDADPTNNESTVESTLGDKGSEREEDDKERAADEKERDADEKERDADREERADRANDDDRSEKARASRGRKRTRMTSGGRRRGDAGGQTVPAPPAPSEVSEIPEELSAQTSEPPIQPGGATPLMAGPHLASQFLVKTSYRGGPEVYTVPLGLSGVVDANRNGTPDLSVDVVLTGVRLGELGPELASFAATIARTNQEPLPGLRVEVVRRLSPVSGGFDDAPCTGATVTEGTFAFGGFAAPDDVSAFPPLHRFVVAVALPAPTQLVMQPLEIGGISGARLVGGTYSGPQTVQRSVVNAVAGATLPATICDAQQTRGVTATARFPAAIPANARLDLSWGTDRVNTVWHATERATLDLDVVTREANGPAMSLRAFADQLPTDVELRYDGTLQNRAPAGPGHTIPAPYRQQSHRPTGFKTLDYVASQPMDLLDVTYHDFTPADRDAVTDAHVRAQSIPRQLYATWDDREDRVFLALDTGANGYAYDLENQVIDPALRPAEPIGTVDVELTNGAPVSHEGRTEPTHLLVTKRESDHKTAIAGRLSGVRLVSLDRRLSANIACATPVNPQPGFLGCVPPPSEHDQLSVSRWADAGAVYAVLRAEDDSSGQVRPVQVVGRIANAPARMGFVMNRSATTAGPLDARPHHLTFALNGSGAVLAEAPDTANWPLVQPEVTACIGDVLPACGRGLLAQASVPTARNHLGMTIASLGTGAGRILFTSGGTDPGSRLILRNNIPDATPTAPKPATAGFALIDLSGLTIPRVAELAFRDGDIRLIARGGTMGGDAFMTADGVRFGDDIARTANAANIRIGDRGRVMGIRARVAGVRMFRFCTSPGGAPRCEDRGSTFANLARVELDGAGRPLRLVVEQPAGQRLVEVRIPNLPASVGFSWQDKRGRDEPNYLQIDADSAIPHTSVFLEARATSGANWGDRGAGAVVLQDALVPAHLRFEWRSKRHPEGLWVQLPENETQDYDQGLNHELCPSDTTRPWNHTNLDLTVHGMVAVPLLKIVTLEQESSTHSTDRWGQLEANDLVVTPIPGRTGKARILTCVHAFEGEQSPATVLIAQVHNAEAQVNARKYGLEHRHGTARFNWQTQYPWDTSPRVGQYNTWLQQANIQLCGFRGWFRIDQEINWNAHRGSNERRFTGNWYIIGYRVIPLILEPVVRSSDPTTICFGEGSNRQVAPQPVPPI